jgi:hypothetical protein
MTSSEAWGDVVEKKARAGNIVKFWIGLLLQLRSII